MASGMLRPIAFAVSAVCSPSLSETVFAHSEGDDHTLLRPIEFDSAAKLSGHTPLHQLTAIALQHRGGYYGRAASFGPHHHNVIPIGIARYVERAACD